jgi:copper chaperone CopZ
MVGQPIYIRPEWSPKMNSRMNRMLALTLGLLIAATMPLRAADPKPTVITISNMHCDGCAKKVTDQLVTVVGVAKAEADVAAKTVKIIPKANATVSPKALWEAVEKADKTPTKLQGPGGTFTEKPKT